MGGGVPGRAKCPTCGDKCCGLARQLVERVAGMEVGGSKVRFVLVIRVNCVVCKMQRVLRTALGEVVTGWQGEVTWRARRW